mgnify:CR=1 FL=1
MQNLYEQLKPKIRKELNESAKKYDSVSRIKYTLMSKTLWSELKVSTVKDLILFSIKNTIRLNEQAYDKVYSKIKAIENEIKKDQYNIDNNMVTPFIPMELHLDVLDYKKREKRVYEYMLNLINKERENGN